MALEEALVSLDYCGRISHSRLGTAVLGSADPMSTSAIRHRSGLLQPPRSLGASAKLDESLDFDAAPGLRSSRAPKCSIGQAPSLIVQAALGEILDFLTSFAVVDVRFGFKRNGPREGWDVVGGIHVIWRSACWRGCLGAGRGA